MIVNPGIRRFLSAGVSGILRSADLSIPLTHSAIPTRGAVTPNFTRATVKNIQNNDGYQVTLLSGELGFPGARRVYNLWTTSSVSLASGANKSLTLPAGAYQFSMGAGTGTATFSGTGGATGTLAASASGRVSVAKTISAGTLVVTASVADLVDLQVVSMVAETDQTTIREYVSVGVESAPAYHGSMVDGVKCLPTDLSGNPLTGMTTPLIELAVENKCLQSQTFDNASWLTNGTGTTAPVVTANQAVAPDGTLTADKIEFPAVPSGAGNRSIVYQGITQTAVAYNDSVYLKGAVGGEVVRVASSPDGTTWQNSSTLTLTTDWVRYPVTGTRTAAVWYLHIGVDQRAGQTLPTSAQTIYAWGAQVELGTAATSYIPTTTTALTRNADQLYYTGALIGTLKSLAAVDFKREAGFSAAGIIASLSDGTSAEYLQVALASSINAVFQGIDGGVTQWNTSGSDYVPGTFSSMAQSFALNDIKMSKDGVAPSPDTVATIPTVTRLEYGAVAGGTLQLNGYPGKVYGWTRNLSQSELGAVDRA